MRVLLVGDLHLWDRNISSRNDVYSETSLRKLEEVVNLGIEEKMDGIICAGDLTHGKIRSDAYLFRVFELLRKSPSWYALAGNHGLRFRNPETYTETTSGLFFSSGLIRHLGQGAIIAGTKVIGIESYAEKDYTVPRGFEDAELVVTHHFIDSSLYQELNLTSSWVFEHFPNVKYVLGGHDHAYYKPKEIRPGTQLLRPGSLMRTSIAKENLDRDIQVLLLETEEKKIISKIITFSPSFSVYNIGFQQKTKKLKDSEEQMRTFSKRVREVQLLQKEPMVQTVMMLLNEVQNVRIRSKLEAGLRSKGLI